MYNKTIIRFVFVISRITKVSVRVISLSLDITKTSSNNCFFMYVAKISGARFAQHILLALPLKRKRIRVIHVPSSNFSNKRLTQNQHFLSYPPLHFICILEFSVVTRSKTMVFFTTISALQVVHSTNTRGIFFFLSSCVYVPDVVTT